MKKEATDCVHIAEKEVTGIASKVLIEILEAGEELHDVDEVHLRQNPRLHYCHGWGLRVAYNSHSRGQVQLESVSNWFAFHHIQCPFLYAAVTISSFL